MNKKQIEVEKAKLAAEKKELLHLKAIYNKAAQDISEKLAISNGKINVMLKDFDNLDDVQKSILQSQIYHRNFQLSLKKQINGFLKDLNGKQYESIDQYMKECYKTGFLGTMYDISGQGIPIITPIDQKQVIEAMKLNSPISRRLYEKLGEDVEILKKRIANNISRGVATASEYKVIARNIAAASNVGFNRAMRVVRTEGHGIQCQAASDAQHAAKKAGADVLKQWDSTLDARTRASHARLDGEIRELDEKFSNGMMRPADPNGGAAEVVNCRCALLQRARWALDDDELQTLKDRAAYFGLDKTKSFEEFEKKYVQVSTEIAKFAVEISAKDILKAIERNDNLLYNISPAKKAYNVAINAGELTALASFTLYQAISKEIDDKLVGLITANGITVESKSDHFIARVIGSVEQKRNGVAIEDIIEVLTNPDRIDAVKNNKNGKSQRFVKKGVCAVTINPDTGNLVQVNPLR